MPGTDDTATATESNRTTTDAPLAAEITVDVSPETYERAHEEYCRAVDEGYTGSFDGYILSNTPADVTVEVDGEPVDPEVHVGAE
jgi:hypothetical protein